MTILLLYGPLAYIMTILLLYVPLAYIIIMKILLLYVPLAYIMIILIYIMITLIHCPVLLPGSTTIAKLFIFFARVFPSR